MPGFLLSILPALVCSAPQANDLPDLLEVSIHAYGVFDSVHKDQIERDRVILQLGEADYEQDLNGDGVVSEDDTVVHVLDFSTDRLLNTGLTNAVVHGYSNDPDDPGDRFLLSMPAPLPGTSSSTTFVYYDLAEERVIETGLVFPYPPSNPAFNEEVLIFGQQEKLIFQVTGSGPLSDLNGDGDSMDYVTSISRRGGPPETLFVGRAVALDGTRLLATLNENGVDDLNGDDNFSDTVAAFIDIETGAFQVISPSLGAWGQTSEVNDLQAPENPDWFPIEVLEKGQGNTDLNKDGDVEDDVLHLHFTRTGHTVNTGYALSPMFLQAMVPLRPAAGYESDPSRFIAFRVDERAQGQDLDGDGDIGGQVIVFRDLKGGVTLIEHQPDGGPSVQQWGPYLSYWHYEPHPLAPWAFTGIAHQKRLLVYDSSTGHVERTRVVHTTNKPLVQESGPAIAMCGRYLFIETSEEKARRDLNGDGDLDDDPLFLYDILTRTSRLTRFEGPALRAFSFEGRYAAFTIDEEDQGEDLNRDGIVNRSVVAFDLTTLESGILPASIHRLRFLRNEDIFAEIIEADVDEDLNGDGDLDDRFFGRVRIQWEDLR